MRRVSGRPWAAVGAAALSVLLWVAAALAAAPAASRGLSVGYGELQEEWRGELVHLSWTPRAFLLKGFLSDEECDHLIQKASPSMQKSTVVDNKTGRSVDSSVRTSSGTFLAKGADDVVARIERRVAQVTMIPMANQEAMQILHYVDGQKYEPHHDFFHDSVNSAETTGGQRVITVLMYLTSPEAGGETVFPLAQGEHSSGPQWSACAQKGLGVKTVRGDALMFYSLRPDGATDPTSLHGSCPVEKGEKWSATKWIHVGPFQPGKSAGPVHPISSPSSTPGGCGDANELCPEWAFFGECEKNAGYMLASCKKSCGLCPGFKKVPLQASSQEAAKGPSQGPLPKEERKIVQ